MTQDELGELAEVEVEAADGVEELDGRGGIDVEPDEVQEVHEQDGLDEAAEDDA